MLHLRAVAARRLAAQAAWAPMGRPAIASACASGPGQLLQAPLAHFSSDGQAEPAAVSTIRVAKMMAHCGAGSRRQAEEMIIAGRVAVNGIPLDPKNLGLRVDALKDVVTIDGKNIIGNRPKPLLFCMHKLKGELVTKVDTPARPYAFDITNKPSVLERAALMGMPNNLIPIGSLDAGSTGLQLLTNDPTLARLMEHPTNGSTFSREYRLKVYGRHLDRAIRALKNGGHIADYGKFAAAELVEVVGERSKGAGEDDGDNLYRNDGGWATGAGRKKKSEEEDKGDESADEKEDSRNKRKDGKDKGDSDEDEDLPARTIYLRVVVSEGGSRMLKAVFGHFGCIMNDCERVSFGPFKLSGIPKGAALKVHVPGWLKRASLEVVGLKEPKIEKPAPSSKGARKRAQSSDGEKRDRPEKKPFAFEEEKETGTTVAAREEDEEDDIINEDDDEDAEEEVTYEPVFEGKPRKKPSAAQSRDGGDFERERPSRDGGRRGESRDRREPRKEMKPLDKQDRYFDVAAANAEAEGDDDVIVDGGVDEADDDTGIPNGGGAEDFLDVVDAEAEAAGRRAGPDRKGKRDRDFSKGEAGRGPRREGGRDRDRDSSRGRSDDRDGRESRDGFQRGRDSRGSRDDRGGREGRDGRDRRDRRGPSSSSFSRGGGDVESVELSFDRSDDRPRFDRSQDRRGGGGDRGFSRGPREGGRDRENGGDRGFSRGPSEGGRDRGSGGDRGFSRGPRRDDSRPRDDRRGDGDDRRSSFRGREDRDGSQERGSDREDASGDKKDFYSRTRRADGGSTKPMRRARLSKQDAAFSRGEERSSRREDRDRRGPSPSASTRSSRGATDRRPGSRGPAGGFDRRR